MTRYKESLSNTQKPIPFDEIKGTMDYRLPSPVSCGIVKKRKAQRSFASCLHSCALFRAYPATKG